MKTNNYILLIIISFLFSSCDLNRNDKHLIKENLILSNLFCENIYTLSKSADTIISLKRIFSRYEYDSLLIFPRYTSIEKVDQILGKNVGLPYKEEVRGNEDLFVFLHNGIPVEYFALKNNIIASNLTKLVYKLDDSTSMFIRVFERKNKNIIYLLNIKDGSNLSPVNRSD